MMLNETKQNEGGSLMAQLRHVTRIYANMCICLATVSALFVLTGCSWEEDEEDEADLVVTQVNAPTTMEAGATYSLFNVVKNRGGENAYGEEFTIYSYTFSNGFRVGVYLSTDDVIDKNGSDILVSSWHINYLEEGATDAKTVLVTIPSNTPPGIYYLGAYADDDCHQPESNEYNNTASIQITVTAPAPAPTVDAPETVAVVPTVEPAELDLAVTHVMEEGTGIYNPGDLIAIDNIIETTGTETAYLVNVAFYASTDPEITNDDYFLGEDTIDVMAPSSINQDLTLCVVPESLPAGTYFIGAIVDSNDDWPEADESNNAVSASSSIEVVMPTR